MTMQTDVKGATCPADSVSVPYNGRTRLKGLWYSATAQSLITIDDGGTTLFTMSIGGAESNYILFPGEGVLCQQNLGVTTTVGVEVVVFYG